MNPFFLTDAYKISHAVQYPEGTQFVYSNITPRKSRNPEVKGVVVFGVRYFVYTLHSNFENGFFSRPWKRVGEEMRDFFDKYFGPGSVDLARFKALHELGYLPLRIKALPEGTVCPIGVPFMTIENTLPEFYWLTNFVETLSQTNMWNMVTAATTAKRFYDLLMSYAVKTGDPDFVKFQGHNFGMRGMSSIESAITTDMAHLLSFVGSDTLAGAAQIPAIYFTKDFDLLACSVPATEHSVMCAGGMGDERETFRRLVCDTYPSGIVSIVSDTWDLWKVLTEIAPSLKAEIEARDGKVVFRPDSGDPVRIICGYRVGRCPLTSEDAIKRITTGSQSFAERYFNDAEAVRCSDGVVVSDSGKVLSENEVFGCMQLLDRHFGSTVNAKGYKVLNPKVGLIYGDSITYERANAICERLEALGYASTNIVFGIGSYTYQYVTRDTYSIACKATWVQINGEGREIFKDPITDDGTKKSACGLLQVRKDDSGKLVLKDRATREEEQSSELKEVSVDGTTLFFDSFNDIRQRLLVS